MSGSLVDKVAKAISQWMNGAKLPEPPNWDRLQESTREAYRDQAQAAIEACGVEEMVGALREAVEANKKRPAPYRTQMPKATALLARLDKPVDDYITPIDHVRLITHEAGEGASGQDGKTDVEAVWAGASGKGGVIHTGGGVQ